MTAPAFFTIEPEKTTGVVDSTREQQAAITSNPFFAEKDENMMNYINNAPFVNFTEESMEQFRQDIVVDAADRISKCLPSHFADKDGGVRHSKAMMVNLYFEYGGNWKKVLKDSRSIGRRTLQAYFMDEIFRAAIHALDPVITLEAKGVVIEIFSESQDDKVRLAAALRWLEHADAQGWDKGVRKQIVANKGSIANTLLNRPISDEEYITTFVKDRLSKLPESVKEAIKAGLEVEQNTLDRQPPAAPVSLEIRQADMSKLEDPFGD